MTVKEDLQSAFNDINTSIEGIARNMKRVAFTGNYDDLHNKPVPVDLSNYYTKAETKTAMASIRPNLEPFFMINPEDGSYWIDTDGNESVFGQLHWDFNTWAQYTTSGDPIPIQLYIRPVNYIDFETTSPLKTYTLLIELKDCVDCDNLIFTFSAGDDSSGGTASQLGTGELWDTEVPYSDFENNEYRLELFPSNAEAGKLLMIGINGMQYDLETATSFNVRFSLYENPDQQLIYEGPFVPYRNYAFQTSVHDHSGQAITPASVTATGAIQGNSISDGTGTLAQLRESVSRKGTSTFIFGFGTTAINGFYHAVFPLPPGFSYSSVTLVSVEGQIGVASSDFPPISAFTVRLLWDSIDVYTNDSALAGQFVALNLTLQ